MKEHFIFGRFFRLTVAACVVVALGACKGNETKPEDGKPTAEVKKETAVRSGYACCNLHYSGDWISDSNLAQLPFIPAGTPIRVLKIDGYRANIDVEGKPYRLGHDYGRAEETTEQWVSKMVVLEDPKVKMAKFSPAVRAAITKGQLMKGMTREQVIMAVGHPQTRKSAPGRSLLALLVVEFRPLLRVLGQGKRQQDRRPFRNSGLHDLQRQITHRCHREQNKGFNDGTSAGSGASAV